MDGLWLDGIEDEDVDASLTENLSQYFGMDVTSVHIDDCDNSHVWIEYQEGEKK